MDEHTKFGLKYTNCFYAFAFSPNMHTRYCLVYSFSYLISWALGTQTKRAALTTTSVLWFQGNFLHSALYETYYWPWKQILWIFMCFPAVSSPKRRKILQWITLWFLNGFINHACFSRCKWDSNASYLPCSRNSIKDGHSDFAYLFAVDVNPHHMSFTWFRRDVDLFAEKISSPAGKAISLPVFFLPYQRTCLKNTHGLAIFEINHIKWVDECDFTTERTCTVLGQISILHQNE